MPFPRLFEPGYIGKMRVKNRIIMAPCERNYANPDGSINQRYVDYLTERAKGGVGLILIESMYVDPVGRNHFRQLGLHDDSVIPGLKRLTAEVHRYGCKIGAELQHGGRQSSSFVTGFQPVAPSSVPCKTLAAGDVPRELTVEEIHEIIERFGQAARRAQEAGFDLVEVHGAHGYLVGQFLSPFSNKREDDYGGSPEKRMRFPLEVVRRVKKEVGDMIPVAYRISAEEHIEGGLTLEDTIPFIKRLEEEGIDLIDISAGIYESVIWIAQPAGFPRGCLVNVAEKVKQHVDIPVSVVGRINNPGLAESILEQGEADFIAMGRALHADPEFPNKAEGGSEKDIRTCPACMKCSDELGTNLPISCSINPAAGREREFRVSPADKPRRVLVVGGGPAGLSCASTAARRGHKVVLYEKRSQLGGQLRLASKPPHKRELAEVMNYLVWQVEKYGIDVRLNTEVTMDTLMQEKPDAVVVATGAKPVIPFTPGLGDSRCHTALDVLEERVFPSGTVLIIGGGLVGCETAALLLEQGAREIVIVEPTDNILGGVGLREGWYLRRLLSENSRVKIHCKTTVERIEESVVLQSKGVYETIKPDHIVLAVGMMAEDALAEQILQTPDLPFEMHRIGDCVIPKRMKEAIHEGTTVGLSL